METITFLVVWCIALLLFVIMKLLLNRTQAKNKSIKPGYTKICKTKADAIAILDAANKINLPAVCIESGFMLPFNKENEAVQVLYKHEFYIVFIFSPKKVKQ